MGEDGGRAGMKKEIQKQKSPMWRTLWKGAVAIGEKRFMIIFILKSHVCQCF
jgi:hypothetical protein